MTQPGTGGTVEAEVAHNAAVHRLQQMAEEEKAFTVSDPDGGLTLEIGAASMEDLQRDVAVAFRQPGYLTFKRPGGGAAVMVTPRVKFENLPSELEWKHQPQGAASGSGRAGAGLAADGDLRDAVARLTLQVNRSSQTTRTYADIGAEALSTSAKVSKECFPQLVRLSDQDPRLQKACDAISQRFALLPRGTAVGHKGGKKRKVATAGSIEGQPEEEQAQAQGQQPQGEEGEAQGQPPQGEQAAGEQAEEEQAAGEAAQRERQLKQVEPVAHTLADLASRHMDTGDSGFNEEKHMQPAAFEMLQVAAEAVGCDAYLMDTHSSGLSNPDARPDATSLAGRCAVATWPHVVYTWEFKVNNGKPDVNTMVGQLLQRSAAALEAQPKRHSIIGVGLTMHTIEVFNFQLELGRLRTTCSGPMPFSIDASCPGFQLLVRVLSTSKHQLGYQPALLPSIQALGQYPLSGSWQMVCQGSAPDESSYVYLVEPAATQTGGQGDGMIVVKLNHSAQETNMLTKLGQARVPHVVRLLGSEGVTFVGAHWHAIALAPYVAPLTHKSSLALVTQVVYDVTVALEAAEQNCNILHRDVTPNNFGHCRDRGWLYDFSAAKEHDELGAGVPTGLSGITGTLLWAPHSVLVGGPHTMSSQLEGLFMSVVYIAADGHVHGRHSPFQTDLEAWAARRRAQFGGKQLLNMNSVCPALRPIVQRLHDLFWPFAPGEVMRRYRRDVTCKEVLQACLAVCPATNCRAVTWPFA